MSTDADYTDCVLVNHRRVGNFDFSTAKCESERLSRKVHVIVSLNDMIAEPELSERDKVPLRHAVDYIKRLEARVSHLESSYERCGAVPLSPDFDVVMQLAGSSENHAAIRVMAREPMIANVGDSIDPVAFVKSRGWRFEPIYLKVKS